MQHSREKILSDAKEVWSVLSAAFRNYQIWRVYTDPETREKYNLAREEYELFFTTSLHAHFVAFVVQICVVYQTDERSRQFCIPTLLRMVDAAPDIGPDLGRELEAICKAAEPALAKLKLLRDKGFAHRDRSHTFGELFQEANITPDEILGPIQIAKALLNELIYALDQTTYGFDFDPKTDTLKLLDHIATAPRPV